MSKDKSKYWIGCDFDGVLCEHIKGDYDPSETGKPVPAMIDRIKKMLADGITVKIFTARMYHGGDPEAYAVVMAVTVPTLQKWCKEHIGQVLELTCEKSPNMREFWDDRAVAVEKDKGTRLSPRVWERELEED